MQKADDDWEKKLMSKSERRLYDLLDIDNLEKHNEDLKSVLNEQDFFELPDFQKHIQTLPPDQKSTTTGLQTFSDDIFY